ncbi:hypothetical protein KEX41_22280 [Burkholderia thailandensis]|nr:hypothetical protein [Burkholderia thailandensis]QIO15847.1 hypothetical protein G9462_19460 [Burkholderia thailandensis]QRA15079.1 hypothetical protein JMY07_27645 [Burkholderia thailandensis]
MATARVATNAASSDSVQLDRSPASQPRGATPSEPVSASDDLADPARSTAFSSTAEPARTAPPPSVRMPRLHRAHTSLQAHYGKLDTAQKLYLNCALALLLYGVTYPLHHAWNFVGLAMLALAFWFAGMVYDALTLYKRIYATHIGKGLLLLAFTGLTNFAIALANQRINAVAGLDPSKFPHTEIFVAILSIPFIALLILMVLYTASVLFLPIYGIFFVVMDAKAKAFFSARLVKQGDGEYPVITGIFRFVSFFIFAGVVTFFAKRMLGDYDRFMTSTTEESVYLLEMYEKSPCDVPQGARVAFLDDDNIVYALRVGAELKFFPQPCKRGAK